MPSVASLMRETGRCFSGESGYAGGQPSVSAVARSRWTASSAPGASRAISAPTMLDRPSKNEASETSGIRARSRSATAAARSASAAVQGRESRA